MLPGSVAVHVLILNAGSSTLRFQVIDTDLERMRRDEDRELARGRIERVGSFALVSLEVEGRKERREERLRDHREAIDWVVRWLVSDDSRVEGIRSLADVDAVGHRVVHGGQRFRRSVRIDEEVIAGIEECIELAPLHNPANLRGIRAVGELLGDGTPQVAVFDTAFHASMPETSYLYALPYHYYRRFQLRRYGFHGTSHRYVAYRYRKLVGLPRERVNVVTLHLGNGCSACAIKGGRSFDTSMGFTPLEGLVMGTRCGDVDPSVVEFLTLAEGLSVAEVDNVLNKHSGLLGISGLTGDMRELEQELEEHDDRRARLAIDVFCARVKRYVGAYHAEIGGADAVVFAGGIGENSPFVRAKVCAGLERLGLELDPARNEGLERGAAARISTDASPLAAWVVPTNEELLIARDTVRVLAGDLGEDPASPAS
jgi:acetate kinase